MVNTLYCSRKIRETVNEERGRVETKRRERCPAANEQWRLSQKTGLKQGGQPYKI